jgi:hypothetical protein
MVSTPLHWHYRRYAGAVHPLNAARFFVQKSAATSVRMINAEASVILFKNATGIGGQLTVPKAP